MQCRSHAAYQSSKAVVRFELEGRSQFDGQVLSSINVLSVQYPVGRVKWLFSFVTDETPGIILAKSTEDGVGLFNEREHWNMEGVIGELVDLPYVSARSNYWPKCKTTGGRRVTRGAVAVNRASATTLERLVNELN